MHKYMMKGHIFIPPKKHEQLLCLKDTNTLCLVGSCSRARCLSRTATRSLTHSLSLFRPDINTELAHLDFKVAQKHRDSRKLQVTPCEFTL